MNECLKCGEDLSERCDGCGQMICEFCGCPACDEGQPTEEDEEKDEE